MKSDIEFIPVKDVTITVVLRGIDEWEVFLLNRSTSIIDTILVTSKGWKQ
jgi:hypothetical protein